MPLTRPNVSQVSTVTTNISDALASLNSNQAGPNVKDIGFILNRGSSGNVAWFWDESDQTFKVAHTTSTAADSNVTVSSTSNLSVNNLIFDSNIKAPTSSGHGITFDNQFGWADLIGDLIPRAGGLAAPTLKTFRGNIKGYVYGVGDANDAQYHIPHDYVPGSDIFLHLHWGHQGTNISGTLTVNCNLTYAKGHQQQSFTAPITLQITVPSLTITNTPQYFHRVDEIQISAAGGAGGLLDTNQLEVDGLMLATIDVAAVPSIAGGVDSNLPYFFTLDVHYQSTGIATKNKVPNFYG